MQATQANSFFGVHGNYILICASFYHEHSCFHFNGTTPTSIQEFYVENLLVDIILMSEITCLLPIEKRITPTIIDNTPNSFKAVLDSSLLVDGCSLIYNGLPRLS